jgi:hypothetical protein
MSNFPMQSQKSVEPEMSSSQVPAIQRSISVTTTTTTATNVSDIPETAALVRLSEKLVGDVVIATGVTFCVAPFLTVVDKAIVQSAAGNQTLLRSGFESMQGMMRNPVAYLKSPTFLLMWGVYAATYSTANSLKTVAEHQEYKQAAQQSSSSASKSSQGIGFGQIGVFLGTTCVNSGTSIMKDRAYARMFGSNSVGAAIPRMSYALWMARDLTVVGSSFILPDLVSGRLAEAYDMDPKAATSLCQLTLPVITQFVAGPLHYMGLDLYNRNLDSKTWKEAIADRSKSLYRGFTPVVMARIARIAPGYGIGGVYNTRLRDAWRVHLIQREVRSMMRDPQNLNASQLVSLLHAGKQQNAAPVR